MPGPVKPRPSRTSPRDFVAMAPEFPNWAAICSKWGVRRHRLVSARYMWRAGPRFRRLCSSTGSQRFGKCWGEGREGAAAGILVKPSLTMSSLISSRGRMIVRAPLAVPVIPSSEALRRVGGLLRKGSVAWQTAFKILHGRLVQAQGPERLYSTFWLCLGIPRRLARYPLDCKKTMRLASPEGHAPSPLSHQD